MTQATPETVEVEQAGRALRGDVVRILSEAMAETLIETEPHFDHSPGALRVRLWEAGYTQRQIDAAAPRALMLYRMARTRGQAADNIAAARRDARIATALCVVTAAILAAYVLPGLM